MGTTLTGTTPQDTYDSLIKVTDNGPLSGTAKYLSDGLGNDSVLALSTSAVGIGNSSPAATLDVASRFLASSNDGNAEVVLASTSNRSPLLYFKEGSTQRGLIYSAAGSNNLIFQSGTTEAMRISSAGNVGIGTSNPVAKLESLDGDIKVTTQSAFAGFVTSRNLIPSSAGTQIGRLQYSAYRTGTTYVDSAAIQAFATEAWSASSTPSWLSLQTVASGSTSLVERVRIDSDGLKFNGDTAAANALDDYEEGTFTPTAASNITINEVTNATYTKVGNIINFQIWIKVDITGTDWVIDGLPIASSGRTTSAVSNINQKETLANQTVGTNIYAYGSSIANGIDLFIGGNYRVA